MKSFTYLEPATLEGALEMKRRHASSVFIAGGPDLVPLMKYDLLAPEAVIALERIPGLAGIKLVGDDLEIGALTRLHELRLYASGKPPCLRR